MKLGTAIALVAKGFEFILDKQGKPYFLHCHFVAENVQSEDEKVVAYLHDVVEDGIYTMKELINLGLTESQQELLLLLTHKKEDSYEKYIEKISTNQLATNIKKADLKHNSDISRLKDVTKKDLDNLIKYHKAYKYLSKL